MPLPDWKRYRDIVTVAIVETQNRITARSIIACQFLNTFIEADDGPSVSPQPIECIFKKRNRCSRHQFRLTIPLDLVKQYDDRSRGEPFAKERQLSNPTRAVVQTISQNWVHLESPVMPAEEWL